MNWSVSGNGADNAHNEHSTCSIARIWNSHYDDLMVPVFKIERVISLKCH